GSATRSVTGGFSKWKMGLTDEDSYAVQLAGVDLRMAMIVALVPAFKQTDDAHREALTSPFFHARLAEMPRLIAEMELAIRRPRPEHRHPPLLGENGAVPEPASIRLDVSKCIYLISNRYNSGVTAGIACVRPVRR